MEEGGRIFILTIQIIDVIIWSDRWIIHTYNVFTVFHNDLIYCRYVVISTGVPNPIK